MYQGKADWNLIAEAKNLPGLTLPVIGNGDIATPLDAERCFNHCGVDGIMIGRAAIGKPWIFQLIREYLETGIVPGEPSPAEKTEIAKIHLTKSLEHKGHPRGIYEMRKHLSNYFKGLPHFKEIKRKLVTTLNTRELYDTLERIAEEYENRPCSNPYDPDHSRAYSTRRRLL
jgi:tRNA-dihydrouridine synthase